jgi:hypothetical protein
LQRKLQQETWVPSSFGIDDGFLITQTSTSNLQKVSLMEQEH